ncbi:MAG TPA: alkaline phosphatase [Actinomycetota bacterium]|nr:alkaline phosphatase [Actinomycetota bacterium]
MRRLWLVVALVATLLQIPHPAAAGTVTVAAAGDIARPTLSTPQQQTADLVTAFDPTTVFALGDLQYENGELANFQSSYDPSWGAFKSKTHPIPGNHDYGTTNAAGYYTYWGSAAGDPSKGYYSFDLGDWHVVALNTECTQINCSAEKSWMKSDLAADGHLCQMVVYHRANLKWPRKKAEAAGVDLALTASRHVYERWAPENGLLRLIVGTGGYSLGKLNSGAVVGIRAYGVVELTLSSSSYSWSFVDTSGDVRDSGAGSCHS